MSSSSLLVREARLTAALALPLIAGQINQMLITLTDTLMIGRLGVVPLAAATFTNTLLYLPFVVGIGLALAVSLRVARARGAGDRASARSALRHGLWLAVGAGVLSILAAWLVQPLFPYFRQEKEVIDAVPAYFHLIAASMLPAMAALAVKSHSDAMNHPWPAFWVTTGGVLLNVGLNWLLIFGHWGAPAMGLEGAGLATLLAQIATLGGLLVLSNRNPALRGWVPRNWFEKFDGAAVRELLRIGLPTSLQLLAEVSAFVVTTCLIGTMGTQALASHQVAISCAGTIFMVPLGISMALTVRVGEALGAGERIRIRPIVLTGWILASAFTLISAQAFLLLNRPIAGWFLSEPKALALTAGLLLVAAAFQLGDALQVVSAGALRGLNDVRTPAWIAVLAYWLVSLPLGWWLAMPRGWGVAGMWWGITAGITFTALALGRRTWRMTSPGYLNVAGPGLSRRILKQSAGFKRLQVTLHRGSQETLAIAGKPVGAPKCASQAPGDAVLGLNPKLLSS